MEVEHHDILDLMKFGELRNEKIFFCEVCGKKFNELDDYTVTDRFGRCFCRPKCRAKYYSRD